MYKSLKSLGNYLYWTIAVLSTPRCWIRSGSYSKTWDRKFNALMKEYKFELIDNSNLPDGFSHFTAKLGPVKVWIANYPYGIFDKVLTRPTQKLPSRKSVLYAARKFERDTGVSIKDTRYWRIR